MEKIIEKKEETLKNLVVEALEKEEWTIIVSTNELEADLGENQIKIITIDNYIIIIEIDENGTVEFIETKKENGLIILSEVNTYYTTYETICTSTISTNTSTTSTQIKTLYSTYIATKTTSIPTSYSTSTLITTANITTGTIIQRN